MATDYREMWGGDITTLFEFQLHPVSTVIAGPIFYAVEQRQAALRF